jgi:hypothetical protein
MRARFEEPTRNAGDLLLLLEKRGLPETAGVLAEYVDLL